MADGKPKTRRELLAEGVRAGGLIAAGALLGGLAGRASSEGTVWQIDPNKCVQCERCATECVLDVSAVKCVHAYALCGYCKLCFGLFLDKRSGNYTTAENVRCPTDAIKRAFVEDPYYEMEIDEAACIGCARCAKGCTAFGNGSMYMQIRHDRCVNCNQCAIATVCPGRAISRVPVGRPYTMKSKRSHS